MSAHSNISVTALIGLLVFGMIFGRTIEGRLFPVSRGFTLDEPARFDEEKHLVLVGEFENVRDCKFVDIAFHYVINDKNVGRAAFIRDDQPKNASRSRGAGMHGFGPWILSAPSTVEGAERMDIFVEHDCQPLWTTRTHLATIKIPKVPKVN